MLDCEICLQMSCKTLGQLAAEALEHLKFAIVFMQSQQLPSYYLPVNSTDQASDNNHNWNRICLLS